MNFLLQQLKKRRTDLKLKQKDMLLRTGISRQQYQHLESKGNPRLDTLELVAKGLNSELMLIPKENIRAVKMVLVSKTSDLTNTPSERSQDLEKKSVADDPWQGLLGDDK